MFTIGKIKCLITIGKRHCKFFKQIIINKITKFEEKPENEQKLIIVMEVIKIY